MADIGQVLVTGATGFIGLEFILCRDQKVLPSISEYRDAMWLALLGTRLLTPFRRLSQHPFQYTPDAVPGWNLNAPVKKGTLRNKLELTPN